MQSINDPSDLQAKLEGMTPWPGRPDGFRAIVTRRMAEDDKSETLAVLGYLRVGSPVFPIEMLYDADGSPLYKSFQAGDFIDSFETFRKFRFSFVKRARRG